ncbi:hypothetical protein JTB14_034530 [Gonioctena quinquepunctata]|nr:hypothetical protein JTB14_034530 [Gonioctena quinquepunctata]
MRESLSYGMFPLLCESMNTPMFNPSSTSLISSNGYYGYQPQIHTLEKGGIENGNAQQVTSDRMEMDVQENVSEENCMQMANERRQENRKRRLENAADFEEFKKRRDENYCKKTLANNLSTKEESEKVLEEILMETHGISAYHWLHLDGLD